MVFRTDTSVLAPTPSPWFSIDSIGENSLFLGQNYPMMVKGDPTAVDTTLLPFMRSNCIYTSDISVVTYPGRDIVGRFSLDDQSCSPVLASRFTIAGPSQRITCGSKQAFPTPRNGWLEVHFIACYLLCGENFSIYNVSSLLMWVDDLLYVIKWYACDKLTKFMNGFRVASVSEWCDEAKKYFPNT